MDCIGFAPPQKVPEPPHPTLEERMTELFYRPPLYSSFGPPPETDMFSLLFPASRIQGPPIHTAPVLQLPAHIDRLASHLRIYQHHAERLDKVQLASEIKQLCRQIRGVAKCVAAIRDLGNQASEISEHLRNIERQGQNLSAAAQIMSIAVDQLIEIARATRRNMRYIHQNGNAVLDVLDQMSIKEPDFPAMVVRRSAPGGANGQPELL